MLNKLKYALPVAVAAGLMATPTLADKIGDHYKEKTINTSFGLEFF